ncbi:hypothetical protein [Kibdelosporangium philippinense]|uniref:hypothetical protein n=1 Tax=Kibdelosporangium philippinense TaxID=211113 RepID=UPI003613C878
MRAIRWQSWGFNRWAWLSGGKAALEPARASIAQLDSLTAELGLQPAKPPSNQPGLRSHS